MCVCVCVLKIVCVYVSLFVFEVESVCFHVFCVWGHVSWCLCSSCLSVGACVRVLSAEEGHAV